MAKKSKQAKAAMKARSKKGGGGGFPWNQFFVVLLMALLMVVALPTMILVFFGMMPSIVALIIDRTPQRYAAGCVAGMNFSGLFPYLMDLWTGANTLAMAIGTLTNVFNLLLIYGAAGFGWMLFNAIPPMVATLMVVLAQRRIGTLRLTQRRLIEEWGEEVSGAKDDGFKFVENVAKPL